MEKRKILRAFSIVEALIVVTVLAIAIVASTPLITRKIAAIKDAGSTLGGSNHGRFEVFYKEIACFGSNCYEKKGPATSITVYERLDDATAKSICSVEPYYNPDYHAKATCYREYKAKPKTNRDGSITKAKIRDDSGSTIEIQKGGKYIFEPNITYSPGTYNPSTDKIFEPGDSDGAIKPDSGTNRVIEGFLTVHAGSYNGSNLWKFDGTDGNIPKVHPIPWETVYSGKKVIIDKPIPGVVVDGETRYIADFDAPEKASNIVFHAVGAGGAGGGLGGNGQNIYTLKDMTATDLTYIKNILKDRVQKICSDNHVICSNDVVRTGGNSEEEKFRTRGGEFGFGYSYNEPVKSDDDSVWPVFDSPWVFLNTETGNIVVKFDTRYDMIKPEELLDYTKELGASTQNSLVYDGPAWWSDWTPFNKFCVGGWTCGGHGGRGTNFDFVASNGSTGSTNYYGADYDNNPGADATKFYNKWRVGKKFIDTESSAHDCDTGKTWYTCTCKYAHAGAYFNVEKTYNTSCGGSCACTTFSLPADDGTINSSTSEITVKRTNYTRTRNYVSGDGGNPGECRYIAIPITGKVSEGSNGYVSPYNGNSAVPDTVTGTETGVLSAGGVHESDCGYGFNFDLKVSKGDDGSSSTLTVSSGSNSGTIYTTGGIGSNPCVFCNKATYTIKSTYTDCGIDDNRCSTAGHAISGELTSIDSETRVTATGSSSIPSNGTVDSDYNIELYSCSTEEYEKLMRPNLLQYMDVALSQCGYVDENWVNLASPYTYKHTCSNGADGNNSEYILGDNCTLNSTGIPFGFKNESVNNTAAEFATTTGLYNFVYHWIIPFSMNYLAYGEGGGAGEYATAKMSDTKSGSETKSIRIELGKPGVWDSTDNTVNSNTSWQGSTTGADGGDTTIDLVSADSTTKRILTAKGGKGGKGGKFTHRYDVGFAHEGNICSTPVYSNGVTTVDAPTGSIETSIDCLRGTELAKTTKNILAAAIEYSAMETIKSLSQSSSIIGIGLGKGAEGAGTTSNLEEYSGYRKLLNSSSSFGTVDSSTTQLVNDGSTLSTTPNNNKVNFTNQLLKPSELNFQGGGGAVIIVW